MESWAEKYRPKSLSDIIGNTKVINDLKSWAGSWGEKMVKRGVILSGPPGCGKTSAAIALANDMGWEVIELNASDARSGAVIEGSTNKGSGAKEKPPFLAGVQAIGVRFGSLSLNPGQSPIPNSSP